MQIIKFPPVVLAVALASIVTTPNARSEDDHSGYKGAARTILWSTGPIAYTDTTKYKKDAPYVIGFSNAGLGDSWRIVMLHSMEQAVSNHLDVIKKFIVTDASHNDSKQASDIEDLVSRGVDVLIVSANTEQALDPVITRVMRK